MKKSVISLEDGHFIIVYTYMITYECLKKKFKRKTDEWLTIRSIGMHLENRPTLKLIFKTLIIKKHC